MSIVVAFVDKDKTIWMGSDSLATSGGYVISNNMNKTYKKDGWIYGCVGSQFMIDHFNNFNFPAVYTYYPYKIDEEKYLKKFFIPRLREHIYNLKKVGSSVEDEWDVNILIGKNGRLFYIDRVLGVAERIYPSYDAIGSGCDFAMGFLFSIELKTSTNFVFHPTTYNEILEKTLKCVATFDRNVAKPFVIKNLKLGEKTK